MNKIIVRTPHTLRIAKLNNESFYEIYYLVNEYTSYKHKVNRNYLELCDIGILYYGTRRLLGELINARGFFSIYLHFDHPALGLVSECVEFTSAKKKHHVYGSTYHAKIKGIDIFIPNTIHFNLTNIQGMTHPRSGLYKGNELPITFTSEVLFDAPRLIKSVTWQNRFIMPHTETELWKSLTCS